MSKFNNDSSILAAQNRAFDLRAYENAMEDAFSAGQVTWSAVEAAAQAVVDAVNYAVSIGATFRDLPAI